MYNNSCLIYDLEAPLIQERMMTALIYMTDAAEMEMEGGLDLSPYKVMTDEQEPSLSAEDTEIIGEAFSDFFPEFYTNASLRIKLIRELWRMIKSDDIYQPDLIQEYVLAHALINASVTEEILEEDGKPPFHFDRILRKNLKDIWVRDILESEAGDTKKEAETYVEEEIRGMENFSLIIDRAFHDSDYEYLDEYTPDELYSNGMDKDMGIGVGEPAYRITADGSYIPVTEETSAPAEITITIKREG